MITEADKFKICRAEVPVQRPLGRKSWCQLKAVRKGDFPLLGEGLAFSSVQAFSWLAEAHQHYAGQSALHSLLIWVLISSKNTLTEGPRILFDQIARHPVTQSSWHIKLTVTLLILQMEIWGLVRCRDFLKIQVMTLELGNIGVLIKTRSPKRGKRY